MCGALAGMTATQASFPSITSARPGVGFITTPSSTVSAASHSSTSSSVPSSTTTSMPGCRRLKLRNSPGKSVDVTEGKLASRMRPPFKPRLSSASTRIALNCDSIILACSMTCSPSAVTPMCRRSRTNTGNPSDDSNWAIAWLAPDCVMPVVSAAREILLASATATSKRQCRRFIMVISSPANS